MNLGANLAEKGAELWQEFEDLQADVTRIEQIAKESQTNTSLFTNAGTFPFGFTTRISCLNVPVFRSFGKGIITSSNGILNALSTNHGRIDQLE